MQIVGCFKLTVDICIYLCAYGVADPVQKVTLAVSDLQRSVHYWSSLLGMSVMEKDETKKTVLMGFGESQVSLCVIHYIFIEKKVDKIYKGNNSFSFLSLNYFHWSWSAYQGCKLSAKCAVFTSR